MILDIDVGNTRIKWRQSTAMQDIRAAHRGDDWQARLALLPRPERVRAACVAGEAVCGELTSWCEHHWSLKVEFASSVATCAGVTNGYDEPARLGVDRWLAMLAAFHRFGGELCIVQAGTAITIDIISSDGHHAGGYILPGLQLMRDVLWERTGQVRWDGALSEQFQPGRNTREAVNGGVFLAAVGAVDAVMGRTSPEARLVCAGGDANVLAAHLGRAALVEQNLVLDGLSLALP